MSSTRDCGTCGREAGFHKHDCRDARQMDVFRWVRDTFGEATFNPRERVLRFLEEAIELAQAEGIEYVQAMRVLGHVYEKPSGDPALEVGGVGVTLLAYCASKGVWADETERKEVTRVFAIDPTYFRERHNAKAAAGIAAWTDARTDKRADAEPENKSSVTSPYHRSDCQCQWCGGLP